MEIIIDQVLEYLNEEYKKNFNWKDTLPEFNVQYQSLQNYNVNSPNSKHGEESIISQQYQNKTSLSPQKFGLMHNKAQRSQSQKIDMGSVQSSFNNIQAKNSPFSMYNKSTYSAQNISPQKLQFQLQDQLQNQQNQEIKYQNIIQQLQKTQQEQFMKMQLLEKKNQLYAQYTKISERLQKQMFQSIKQSQKIQQQQQQQEQINQQQLQKDQIQEIEEEQQEQIEEFDDIRPMQNIYESQNQYYHKNDKFDDEEGKTNLSFHICDGNSKLSSIQKPENYTLTDSNQMNQKINSQIEESEKFDMSNNINVQDSFKQSELSSIKNSSRFDSNNKRNQEQIINGFNQNTLQKHSDDQNLNSQKNSNQFKQQHLQKSEYFQNQQEIASLKQKDNQNNKHSQHVNIVDGIPTVLSVTSSNFQAQYEHGQGEDYNSYELNSEEQELYTYFTYAAIHIQKNWRGYYTRKLLQEFFLELEEMYKAQEVEYEQQRRQPTEYSQNSQQQYSSSSYQQYSQKMDDSDKSQKQEKFDEDKEQLSKVNINQQSDQKSNYHSNNKEQNYKSSQDKTSPFQQDSNKYKKHDNTISSQDFIPKKDSSQKETFQQNASSHSKIINSPSSSLKNKSDASSKDNSENKKHIQQTYQSFENPSIQSQQNKISNQNKHSIQNFTKPADSKSKKDNQKLSTEYFQMKEINEFSKSLVTLKDFDKSSELNIQSKNKYDYIQKEESEICEINTEFQSSNLQKSVTDDFTQKQNEQQCQQIIKDTQHSLTNQNVEKIIGVAQKYQDNFQKMQEEYVNQWTELINDLQSLQSNPQNQVDKETIKKLCEKYEISKKHVIEEYQNTMQDQQISIINQKDTHEKLNMQKSQESKLKCSIEPKKEEECLIQSDASSKNEKVERENQITSQQSQYDQSPQQRQKNNFQKREEKIQEKSNMRFQQETKKSQQEKEEIDKELFKSNDSDALSQQNSSRKNNGIDGISQSLDFYDKRIQKSIENKYQSQSQNYPEFVFENIPFKQFTADKYSRLIFKKESIEDLVKMREEVIHYQKEAKLDIINQMLEQKKVSPQIFEAKKRDIELWVIKEKEKLIKNQHEIERGWKKFAETVKQTRRGIDFMQKIKKIDNDKLITSLQDETKLNKILLSRIDSEASEGDNFNERRENNSLSFNLNNKINNSGINPTAGANFSGGISPNNIKIFDSYELQQRTKKYILGQKNAQRAKSMSAANVNSKSCASWDGNILNTNNSEEVEYEDINDYLLKMKNQVTKYIPFNQQFGQIGAINTSQQQQVIANNSQNEELSIVSPGISKSHTPLTKKKEEIDFKKKQIVTEPDRNDLSKENSPSKFIEMTPNNKQKLTPLISNTLTNEIETNKFRLSFDSASSSNQQQSLELGQQLQGVENGRRLSEQEIKKLHNLSLNSDDEEKQNVQTEQKSFENDQKQNLQTPQKSNTNEISKQETNKLADEVIENLVDDDSLENKTNKQKERQTSISSSQSHQSHHNNYISHQLIDDVMPPNLELKTQLDEQVIPIESCANLHNIKEFLVALAEFIKDIQNSLIQRKLLHTNILQFFFQNDIILTKNEQSLNEEYFYIQNFRDEFLERVNQPLGIDPLEFLKTFNITENTEGQDTEASSSPIYPLVKYIHIQKPVVSEEIFLTFNELYQRMIRSQKRQENRENLNEEFQDSIEEDDDIDIFNSQSDIEKYNLKLIFDCFNEALDFLRPHGLGGKPLPWKLNQKKLANVFIRDKDIERVLGMGIGRTLKWGSYLCGFIPEKIEFPSGQDEENNEYLNQIKEDRLAQMLENEVLENEQKWLSYEEEETDVQLEISDDIFHYLIAETAQWLYLKTEGKLNLMETLEIKIGREFKQNFEEMVEDEEDQKQLLDYQSISESYKDKMDEQD